MKNPSSSRSTETRKRRNREAAARSRATKKVHAVQREELIEQLTLANAELQRRVEDLVKINERLVQPFMEGLPETTASFFE
jgi:hypothetical protein